MNVLINGRIIVENEILDQHAIMFDTKVRAIIPQVQVILENINVIDAGGLFISPGFIDIHQHGAFGYDHMDADEDAAIKMLQKLPKTGVTTLYPSTMSMGTETIRAAIECIGRLMKKNYKGTCILGCHMEGPFFSPEAGGAQPRQYIIPPDYNLVSGLEDIIKLISIAPEVEGALEFIRRCISADIRISLGHTFCHYEDAIVAFTLGATSVTHTFCAMHQPQHREPGIIAAASECPSVYCELIVDNLHIYPASQRLLLKLKGIERIILVSDSMRFAGMGHGESELAGQRIIINEEGAKLECGWFAGSVLALNEAVINFKRNNSLSISDAIKPVTKNPAQLMGIYGQKGIIAPGADADFVLINEEISVHRTFIAGETVYE